MFNIKDIEQLIVKKKIRYNSQLFNSFQDLYFLIHHSVVKKKSKWFQASNKVKIKVENKIKEKVNVI